MVLNAFKRHSISGRVGAVNISPALFGEHGDVVALIPRQKADKLHIWPLTKKWKIGKLQIM
jgi:hypothetical protein